MTDKSKLNDVNRKKRKAEHAALEKAKNRIRIINYLLERANGKLMAIFDYPGDEEFEALAYDLGALEVIWRKHLLWLSAIGLQGVGRSDTTEVRDYLGYDAEENDYPAEILEA
jgi:hypothetical protein